MKDALNRLDRLTNEEARMATAQILRNTHVIDVKLTGVDKKVEGVDTQVKNVRGEVQHVGNNVDDVKCSSSVLSSLTVENLIQHREPTMGEPKKMAIPVGSIYES
jgi:archaellum component FlaC